MLWKVITMKLFDDDGSEINPALIPTPSLCTTCINDDDETQYALCILNRFSQKDSQEFICGAYASKFEIDSQKGRDTKKEVLEF